MATIITNQATLNYRYGIATATAVSNVTSTVLNAFVDVSKTALGENYRVGQNVTYVISVNNNRNLPTNGILLTDDLGTYTVDGDEFTPLTYVGPAQLFINGVFDSVIQGDTEDGLVTFSIPSIPANGNAQVIYTARVNQYADPSIGGEITNTVFAENDCDCPCDTTETANNTITAEEFADLRIVKSVCPNPVICGEELRYTFDIYNYGNQEAVEVVLNDRFDPELTDINVYVDGVLIDEDDYSYINGTLRLPSVDTEYEITVPAASFQQGDDGIFNVEPGKIQIIVTGNL